LSHYGRTLAWCTMGRLLATPHGRTFWGHEWTNLYTWAVDVACLRPTLKVIPESLSHYGSKWYTHLSKIGSKWMIQQD
jgi:hypothetical protein